MLSRRSILIVAVAAGVAAMTPAIAASPQPFDAKAFADAQKAGKPILVAIHATWCPTCKAQKPILGELTTDPKFKSLAYFVIDFDSQKELVRRFGAQNAIDIDCIQRRERRGPIRRRYGSRLHRRLAE